MSARSWNNTANSTGQGLVYLDFSLQLNGSSNPTLTYATNGAGGTPPLARGDGVATVTRSGTGILLVTLSDGYRYVVSKTVNLEDAASGSDDGAYATDGPVTGEGAGNSTPLTFNIFTRAVNGTKTDYTGRRLSIQLVLKNSAYGK